MIEIIALIFLAREIGRIASRKGLKRKIWWLYTVLAWIAGEFVGAIIGLLIFTTDNIISIELVAVAGAITGYVILKANLSKRSDAIDEIDQIGNPEE